MSPPPLAPLTPIAATSLPPPLKPPTPRSTAPRASTDERAAAEARASSLELRAAALEAKLAAQAQEAREKILLLGRELEAARAEAEAATGVMEDLRKDVSAVRDEQEEERKAHAAGAEALREALRQEAFRARAEARERLARESVRLGTLSQEGGAFSTSYVLKDGSAMVEIKAREKAVEIRRAVLADDQKALKKRKATASRGGGPDGTQDELDELDLLDLDESMRLRLVLLQREAAEVAAERKALDKCVQAHVAELRRMQDFDALPAEMRDCPSFPRGGREVVEPARGGGRASDGRFVILDLIATGGFAAVYRAYDLTRHTVVACKLHHISSKWDERRKDSFIRHVEREFTITNCVQHRRVVETFAAFEVDDQTIVTVMPYCNGGSLADMLARQGPLPEKEAKSIIVQVLVGLRHLHAQREPIIHYDLKPANILFHEGEVRLSDFGLSKRMDPDSAQRGGGSGMELTSYGSGTHGYLPPECYEGDASRICQKVDIFSAGVVWFTTLFYPQKPFFSDASQQQIMKMSSHSMRAETQRLAIPESKPALSAEAAAALRRSLAPRRDDRPNAQELLQDPYFAGKAK